jgi:hypothetical protein
VGAATQTSGWGVLQSPEEEGTSRWAVGGPEIHSVEGGRDSNRISIPHFTHIIL